MKEGVFFLREGDDSNKCLKNLSAFSPENIEPTQLLEELKEYNKWWVKDKLAFVGIYKFQNDSILYCIPKYFGHIDIKKISDEQGQELIEHMDMIVQAIEKLRSENHNIEEGANVFDSYQANAVEDVDKNSVESFLLSDYYRYGIYKVDSYEYSLNGKGKTKWGKTIQKCTPIVEGNNIVYTQRIVKKHIQDESQIISKIHKTIIYHCMIKKIINGYGESVECDKDDLIDVEQLRDYVPVVKGVLNATFDNRHKEILKAMISWLEASPYYKPFAGTNDFANVWEWINDSVFGNLEEHNSSKPEYTLFNSKYVAKGEVKPDTIYINNDNNSFKISIYDSKYYVPRSVYLDDGIMYVDGLPASSDIAKQIAYRYFISRATDKFIEIAKEENKEYSVEISNDFLIPRIKSSLFVEVQNQTPDTWEKNLVRKIGKSNIGAFSGVFDYFNQFISDKEGISAAYNNDELLSVGVIEVDPDRLYEMYLADEKFYDK